jgi:hypothetical protein
VKNKVLKVAPGKNKQRKDKKYIVGPRSSCGKTDSGDDLERFGPKYRPQASGARQSAPVVRNRIHLHASAPVARVP